MTIPLHQTVICKDLMWSVPSSINSSSEKVIILVAKTCPTTFSNSYGLVLLGTRSFRTLGQVFLCASKVIKRDRTDTWAGIFFNCSTIKYSLRLGCQWIRFKYPPNILIVSTDVRILNRIFCGYQTSIYRLTHTFTCYTVYNNIFYLFILNIVLISYSIKYSLMLKY